MLYSNAMRLDSTNFALAVDVAKSYYGIKPWRFEDAMRAWTNALNLAGNDSDRQEIYTHFARIQIQAGNYDHARQFLEQVNDPRFAGLKNRMLKTIRTRQSTGA
jgi:predicted negative regulator of RcsB-dependent stress response